MPVAGKRHGAELSSARNGKPVVIAGGGIGGVACALGLAIKGFRVVVIEQAHAFGEIGAGIQLAPNAWSALDALGVGPLVKREAVFMERILDLFAIVTLGLAAGFVSFRSGLPSEVQIVFAAGIVFVIALAGGLLTMRNFGRRIIVRLPIPERFVVLYDRFEEGVFASMGLRALPSLVLITGMIWATEATRLYLVVQALGLTEVHLGISGAFFIALSASLLTAIPITPAGLGFVEGALVGLLTIAYGVPQTEALAITVVDRTISVLTIIVLGTIAYALSSKRRGVGLEPSDTVA